jgi:hypothetical protein
MTDLRINSYLLVHAGAQRLAFIGDLAAEVAAEPVGA